ncbi:MAG TPA: pilus assembly protein N-terminal domain-containing protein [Pirellulales bacterium]|jgi:pilus assembly protein CpaC|nr:pilus assembly protein N-terminal domain-containing protein [Pirellulales bacterium]
MSEQSHAEPPPPSSHLPAVGSVPRAAIENFNAPTPAIHISAVESSSMTPPAPLPRAPTSVRKATYEATAAAADEQDPFDYRPPARAPLLRPAELASKPSIKPIMMQGNADPFAPAPERAQIKPLGDSPFEVIDETGEWTITIRRSKLLRTKMNIYRTAVVDQTVCDVVQFTPREVSLIGKSQGATHVTFWFEGDNQKPITYLVRVVPDPEVQQRREKQYRIFEEILAELFPDSKIRLQPIADKLIVKGQAKDSEEAAQIMAIIRGEAVRNGNRNDVGYNSLVEGRASDPILGEDRDRRLPASQIVNMLRVPGIQQVALRVKIAELNRTAAREFGVDMDVKFDVGNGSLLLQSMLNAASGGSASVLGHFNGDKVNFGIHFLEQHGVVRLLSEPTLVTMSGRPASFVAGGEFAVPTTVGVSGAAAVTTEFRSFGAIISFLPTVLDKDRIRMEVAPEFSKVDRDLTVNNTPGLSTRAVTTTVEMREGQTLAIAGLLDDAMTYNSNSDFPFLSQLFGRRTGTRNETELMILVTPELVHPMDPEEVPPLPGFDVTEPSHNEFYLQGQIEGRPTHETRTTVWPTLQRRYQGSSNAMISGPFGHGQ